MADIYGGTSGDVTASGFNCDLDQWSFDVGAEDRIAYRTFSSLWKSKKNVGYGGSGSFRGTIQFDAAGTKPLPDSSGTIDPVSFEGVSFTLTAEAGCTYTFTGNVTTTNQTRSAGDRMIGVFNFEVDGAVSTAWDETA